MTTPPSSPFAPTPPEPPESQNPAFPGGDWQSGGYPPAPAPGGYQQDAAFNTQPGGYPPPPVPGGYQPDTSYDVQSGGYPSAYDAPQQPGAYPGEYPPQQKSGTNKLLIIIPIAVLVLVLVVGGLIFFFTGDDTTKADERNNPSPPAPTTPVDPTPDPNNPATPPQPDNPSPSPEKNPNDSGHAKFGETFTWADGLSITVSMPEAYAPGSFASQNIKFNPIKVTLTAKNGMAADLDNVLFLGSVQSGGVEATTIFDFENGVTGYPPTGPLLLGKEISWDYAVDAKDTSDLVLSLTRLDDFKAPKAIFVL